MTDVQLYIRCMDEIRLRDSVLRAFISRTHSTGLPIVDIEVQALQFRKIGETLMLASLCVHKKQYTSVRNRIQKEWDPNAIKNTLDRIHPDFYPVPFTRTRDPQTGKSKNQRILDGFLSKTECISMIGGCSAVLHAFNPFNDETAYATVDAVKAQFPLWRRNIRRLVNSHEIRLLAQKSSCGSMYLRTEDSIFAL